MRTYHVKVAVRILEIYAVLAEDAEQAADAWSEGTLILTCDEALDTEILTVKER